MRIVFVRHGKPNYKLDNLTEEGHLQAKAVAQRIKDENISQLFSSPCGRAYETAEYVSKETNLPITVLDFMHEVSWGEETGKFFTAETDPWKIVEKMVNSGETLNNYDIENVSFFKNNHFCKSCDRVITGIDQWLNENGFMREGLYYRNMSPKQTEKTVCIVSHGGASSAALAHIFNLPIPLVLKIIRPRFTAVTVVHFPEKEGLVTPNFELLNDARHINSTEIVFGK